MSHTISSEYQPSEVTGEHCIHYSENMYVYTCTCVHRGSEYICTCICTNNIGHGTCIQCTCIYMYTCTYDIVIGIRQTRNMDMYTHVTSYMHVYTCTHIRWEYLFLACRCTCVYVHVYVVTCN